MGNMDALKSVFKTVQILDEKLRNFHVAVGEDGDFSVTRIQDINAEVGVPTSTGITEECTTIWETFTLLRSLIMDPLKFQGLETKLIELDLLPLITAHLKLI